MVQEGQTIAAMNLRETKAERKRERKRAQKEDRGRENGGEGEREVNEKFRGRRSRGGTWGCLPFITASYPLMESSCPHLSTVLPQRHAVPR